MVVMILIIVVDTGKLTMNNTAYCDLKSTGSSFNNKPLYKCEYCGLTVGLEDPNTKIMCFKKIEDLAHDIHKNHLQDPNTFKPTHLSDKKIPELILEEAKKEAINNVVTEDQTEELCTQEEINNRLAICNTCEYFKDNSCLLCGCVVVREANHKNKLAHRNQKCPADKWGPINLP